MIAPHTERGFSLVEALVALSILLAALSVLARLLITSADTNRRAAVATSSVALAIDKMEQLRGLAWGFDALGLPRSDVATDAASSVERPTGGPGLTPSPPGALGQNTIGYCDFVDATDHSLGGGAAAPPGAQYVRRWSIDPLPEDPDNTLVLQVVVLRADGSAPAARLVSVKTRKAS